VSEHSSIEWTEATWNPWMGCTKVSAGCDHCYMFTEQRRYGHDPAVVRRSKTRFTAPLTWKEPKLIFTCSWSDWFHKAADPWRDEAWEIVRQTPRHTFQILTKRPGRISRHLPADWGNGYPNVWLGTSVENQSAAFRAEQLADIPAQLRFLSCEPLLGPIAFGNTLEHFSWMIVGGESGAWCRPMDLAWARSLRDQAALHNVAFFLKQLGGCPDKRGHDQAVLDGRRYSAMPAVNNYVLNALHT